MAKCKFCTLGRWTKYSYNSDSLFTEENVVKTTTELSFEHNMFIANGYIQNCKSMTPETVLEPWGGKSDTFEYCPRCGCKNDLQTIKNSLNAIVQS